jgi:hypothetical protein
VEEKLVAICPNCAKTKRSWRCIHFCGDCELYFEVAKPERVEQIKRNALRREQTAKSQD